MMLRSHMARAAAVMLFALVAQPGIAAEGTHPTHPEREAWTFSGPFGHFDRAQLQRGFKVYREVCSSCHAMNLVSFRNLGQEGALGFSEAQVKAIAAEYKVQDGPDADGQMFERPAVPADRIPKPFPNEAASRAANGGAYPPDLSVIAKARSYDRGLLWSLSDIFTQYQEHGADYIHAVLTGYKDVPPGAEAKPGLHYNPYFPGSWIAMPKPLNDDQVQYSDGSPQTVEQYSQDVTAFLMWAAEPHLEARKHLGFQVLVFLLVFGALVYFTKRKVWSGVEH